MSDRNDKGVFQSAADKTKEVAGNVKESLSDAYDKMTGKESAEDSAARKAKEGVDTCAKKAAESRDYAAQKMHDAARTVQGH